ncbi:protein kinase [Verrucomicrobiales bacterium BCK34]|nr:protein kinase [Verrucomicrobiales bacterium BCK34]
MEEKENQNPAVNHCPECKQALDVSLLSPYSKIKCTHCGESIRVRTSMGQYDITGLLGEGGMSQVFRASDRHLGREVALKVLHQALSRDANLTAMFEREAKLTALIIHPNVVKVYAVGQDQGYFFIAMELVDATGVEKVIEEKGAIGEAEVLRIAHDVTNGLRAAYDEHLIHRDIKPGNMLVTEDGTTKLVDFGLAVQQGGVDESEDLWATPFYVPPEKLDGEPDTYLGDIYSLGATLYHALAGVPPFEANTSSLEELKEIKKQSVNLKAVAPGVSKATIKLIEAMMAYSPQQRPQSYEELLKRIDRILLHEFGRSSRYKTTQKSKIPVLAGIAGGLMIFVVILFLMIPKEEVMENPSLGIVGGERVIDASENSNAEQFLKAREHFSTGRFRQAGKSFDDLAKATNLSPSTRMWTGFFRGTIALLEGREADSREAFLEVQKNFSSASEDSPEVTTFLGKISSNLLEPFPFLKSDVEFGTSSFDAVGWLLAGLKNWQCGEFESGIEYLKKFESCSMPSQYAWKDSLTAPLKAYYADFSGLKSLPNPVRKGSTMNPSKMRAALKEAAGTAQSPGRFPALIQERLDRVDEIQKLVAEEKAASAAAAETVVEVSPGGSKSDSEPEMASADEAAAQSELDELRALYASFAPYSETLLFTGAVAQLEALEFESASGAQLQAALIEVYTEAGAFIQMLANLLEAGNYKGKILRREGVPLNAAITAANTSTFTVDLGFGPNEVEVESFDPAWMIASAVELQGDLSPENMSNWQTIVAFAIATNQGALAMASGEELAAVSPEFSAKWTALAKLLP